MTDLKRDDIVIPETQASAEDARRADQRVGRALGFSIAFIAVIGVVAGAAWWLTRPPKESRGNAGPAVGPSAAKAPPPGAIVDIPFRSVGPQSGVLFDRENGAQGEKLLPETMGGGVAIADLDSDGMQDLVLINGIPWPWAKDRPNHLPTAKVYVNAGKGNFVEATDRSGLDIPLQGMGIACGDYDGDGKVDLYVTTVGQDHLFRNETERGPIIRFRDVTEEAGIPNEDAWGTSAGFVDYDRDGDLDLFVCRYVEWSPEIDRKVGYQLTGVGRAYGPPDGFAGVDCKLYRNDEGKFTDVTDSAGIAVRNPATQKPMAKALGVLFVDVDRDGWLDILVANDKVAKFLFHNKQDGTFEEIGAKSGFAFDRNGAATAAMGIDGSHFRDDARIGVAIGNFANEMSSLYVNDGTSTTFADDAIPEGIGPPTRRVLSFGTLFLDADLDGWPDLVQSNGHIEDEINRVYQSQQYTQPGQLFRNIAGIAPDGPAFCELPSGKINDLAQSLVARGSAYGDLDQDGDLDIVVMQPKGQPSVLQNELNSKNGWIRLKLVGTGKNKDAIGAEVEVVADGRTQRQMVSPTKSYLSQSELTLTFGLGRAKGVDKVRIRWPDGSEQLIDGDAIPMRSTKVIEQGKSAD